jgi:hypothetical protein
MTSSRDPDRLIHQFLLEGEEHLQDQVFDAVRASIEHKRQRALVRPWRTPTMNKLVPIGLGAAAVVAVLILGSGVAGIGTQPTPSAEPSASPGPSLSPPAVAASLTQSFTSTLHGISMSYPEGWTAQTASGPWTDSTFPLNFGQPHADWLSDPVLASDLFLAVASQPIGDSAPEDWVAAQMASGEGCTATEPITVDGATGLIGADGCDIAVVTTAGRGYWIQLYTSGDDPVAVAPYDRAWFEEVLATVQLLPEDAGSAPA